MKTASILSFQFADNYGALLQIYALQTVLEREGLRTEIINFKPYKLEEPYRTKINFKKSVEYNGLINSLKLGLAKLINSKKINNKRASFDLFRNEYLNLTKDAFKEYEDLEKANFSYDFYFVGSDQVWNPDFFKYTDGAYFLEFASQSKKISYAASVAKSIDSDFEDYFTRYLPDFKAVSVREESSKNELEKLVDIEVSTTLDPSLLLTKNEWKAIINNDTIYDPFILIYDLEPSNTIIELANNLSKQTGLKIVSYSDSDQFEKKYFSFNEMGPNDFIKLFNDSEYVITSSFHGTAFSLIFEKKFYTVPHSTRGVRMINLLEDVGLLNRLITESNLETVNYNEDIDYFSPREKLNVMRELSLNFIRQAIR